MKTWRLLAALLMAALLLAGSAPALFAQDEGKTEAAENGTEESKEEKEKSEYKKYEEVITDEAITREGVFNTHLVGEKLYYEIPADSLGKEFLWVAQFSKTQTGVSFGGMPITYTVVRWERRGKNILLREVDYKLRAKPDTPVAIAVEASSLEAIIGSFKIVAFKDEEQTVPVIDVSSLFLGDTPEFSPKDSLNAAAIDKSRTFFETIKSFPKNVEVRVLATYKLKPSKERSSRDNVTVELHHSMVLLPEKPMLPRLFDYRVGYFAGSFEDYSTTDDEVDPVVYISRWRLEKKDPDAELSEPVEPIVYYVGRGVPERWRKYVAEGIEMWQPAFEKAGFKNAIIAKEPPSKEEDPDWDAEDARYSVIRWLPSTIQNAFGPHVRDPRTGEILEADVRLFHNVIKIARDWYFTRAGAADPRAHKLPFPEDLQGELIRYVAAHEVGHTLGLRHNHKSSHSYTVEQLRDPEYTKKYGYMSSIMDYSRFNYVAQPGDGAVLGVNEVFPYDHFAIEWGYKEFKGTSTPEEDKPYLNEIAARQLEDPKLLFASYEEGTPGQADPFARSSDMTGDPVGASTMGMKNLQRIMGYVYDATTEKNDNFELLRHMYWQLLAQFNTYMTNVAVMVGGVEYNKLVAGQEGDIFVPLPVERQRDAVDYLLKNALYIQDWMIPDEIISKIGMHGVTSRVNTLYSRLLGTLVDDTRLSRMLDLEVTTAKPYRVAEMMGTLTGGIFAELKADTIAIDVFRRGLQGSYVDLLIEKYENEKSRPEIRTIAYGNLMDIKAMVDTVVAKDMEDAERYHLRFLSAAIEEALDD